MTKISELPEYSGSTIGTYLLLNNSGNTETFIISKESLFSAITVNSLNVLASDIVLNNFAGGTIWTANASRGAVYLHDMSFSAQTAGTDYLVQWTGGETIPDFTYSSGVFTNTSSRIRKFIFTWMCGIRAQSSSFVEADIWFSQGGTFTSTNRYGQIAYSNADGSTSQLMSTSWVFILTSNDTVRCYTYANQAYIVGGAAFGNADGYTCRLSISELL